LTLNIWWEDSDLIWANWLNGTLLGFPSGDVYYMGNYGVGFIYEWIVERTGFVLFYPFLISALTIITTTIIVYFVVSPLPKDITAFQKNIFTLLAILLVLLPNIVHFQFTRLCYLIGLSGLLLFLPFAKLRLSYRLVGIVLFTWGFLIRTESGIVCLFLVSVYTLFTHYKPSPKTVAQLFLPWLIALSVFANIQGKIMAGNTYYDRIEPDVEYQILERNNMIPLSAMTNAKDSARYLAAKSWMISDSVNISPDFLRSLLTNNNPFMLPSSVIINSIKALVEESPALPLLFALVIVLLIFYALKERKPEILLLITIYLIPLLLPIVTVKAVARHIEPFILVSCVLLFFYSKKSIPLTPKKMNVAIAVVFLFAIALLHQNYRLSNQYNVKYQEARNFLQEHKKTLENKYVLNFSGLDIIHAPVFEIPALNFKYINPEMAQLSYVPAGRRAMHEMFPCDYYDYRCRVIHILSRKDNTLVLCSNYGFETYRNYLDKVHGIHLEMTAIPNKGKYTFQLHQLK
jgi:hypothetical protein